MKAEDGRKPGPASDVAFTPAVKAAQEERGSRAVYGKMEEQGQQGGEV